ncbi:DUF6443 domain-containing protein [Ekhidna sp.]|uniref:DUF6443 domain-containing protein n=1 Tax=Ekhidna sp. TaxID=2608089 RepID=UPI003B50720B
MNHSLTTTVRLSIFGLFSLIALFASSQSNKYVHNATVSADISGSTTNNYYFTGTVTISPPSGGGSTTISSSNGTIVIKPYNTEAPPSTDENFAQAQSARNPVTSYDSFVTSDIDSKNTSYSYVDGTGRPLQDVIVRAGNDYEDIVNHHAYDIATGRKDESYLPYAYNNGIGGTYVANSINQLDDFYDGTNKLPNDTKYYSTQTYDERGRVATSTGPGNEWHANSKSQSFAFKYYNPTTDGPIAEFDGTTNSNNYAINELTIVEVTNSQNQKTRIVTDLRGLQITSQVYDQGSGKWIGSYNVYDDFGRLIYVIPPTITSAITAGSTLGVLTNDQINGLCFQYQYNDRGDLIREKAPGSVWTEYVYDIGGRLRLKRNKISDTTPWTFYKYDVLNRVIMAGKYVSTLSIAELESQSSYSGSKYYEERSSPGNLNTGYSGYYTFPIMTGETSTNYIEAVYYYDDYSFEGSAWWDTDGHNFSFSLPTEISGSKTNNVLDLKTGSKVRISGTNQWLNSIVYYDDYSRVIQVKSENHVGGLDILSNQLDWEGELQKTHLDHSGYENLTLLSEYEYEHNGALNRTYQTINGGTRTLVADYQYNLLGQLVEKNLHSTDGGNTFLQSVDYRYNIRGWMESINNVTLTNDGTTNDDTNDLFGANLRYTSPVSIAGQNTTGRYDGLLTAFEWNATNNVDNSIQRTASGYNYNNRNWLSNTTFGTHNGSSYSSSANHFAATATYDENGNLDVLTRKEDGSLIDNLDYDYYANSNQLKSVNDLTNDDRGFKDGIESSIEYKYNEEGQMYEDLNKEIINIIYNDDQLITEIEFYNGEKMVYSYDVLGNRLSKSLIDSDDNTVAKVDYVGLVEYLDNEINQVFTDEGRAYQQNGEFHYEYFITDHQANNRVAFGNLPERNVYVATMENEKSSYEESEFAFPSNIRSTAQNHTPLGNESVALNGTLSGREVGPARVLAIAPGDEVDLEAWAKYTDGGWNNSSITDIVSVISSAFGGASAGTGAESASSSLNNALSAGSPGVYSGNTSGQPEAYLQYLFFDNNYNYVANRSGFIAVSNASNGKFAKLEAPTIEFGSNESGYLFVYIVNESNQNKDVFFDDLKITHASATSSFKVTQVNDYYPFGLPTSNSWRAPGYIDPGLLYQSSFSELDSITGYYDFLSRSYDPVLGRFFAMDPARQYSSPYMAMGNSPHMHVDPNGELAFLPFVAFLAKAAATTAAIQGAMYTVNVAMSPGGLNNWNLGDFGTAVGKGAIRGAVTAGLGELSSIAGAGALGDLKGFGGGVAKLGYEALSTTAVSAIGNLAVGDDWNAHLNVGVGPLTLPFRNGEFSTNPLDHVNNIAYGIDFGKGLYDVIQGDASLKFDVDNMNPYFQEKSIFERYRKNGKIGKTFWNKELRRMVDNKHTLGITTPSGVSILNGDKSVWGGSFGDKARFGKFADAGEWAKTRFHEGVHVQQTRFSGNAFFRSLFDKGLHKYYDRIGGYSVYPWEWGNYGAHPITDRWLNQ